MHNEVIVGKAVITGDIAKELGNLQVDDNDSLHCMIDSITNLKNFLIDLHGRDCDADAILGHLAEMRQVEHTLLNLMKPEK